MKKLHVNVANKIASYSSRDGDIVCGNSDYVIKFAFDSEWDSYSEKTARFVWNGMYEDVKFTGTDCPVPLLRNTTLVSVGVYAGDLSTTTRAIIGCKTSILCETNTAQPEQAKEYRDEAGESAEQAKAYAEQAKQYRDEMGLVENRLDSRIDHNEKRITNLEQQINPSHFLTDDTTVYAKEVPARACPYAQIDKLGTMGVPVEAGNLATVESLTVEGDNTLPFTYENGVLTVEGELTTNGYVDIGGVPDVPNGTTFVMKVPDNFKGVVSAYWEADNGEGYESFFDFVNDEARLYDEELTQAEIACGHPIKWVVWWIELQPLSNMTNPSFPLDCRIKPEKVTALVSEEPKNLLKLTGVLYGHYEDDDTLTATFNEDGTFTLNGVSQDGAMIDFLYPTLLLTPGVTYKFKTNLPVGNEYSNSYTQFYYDTEEFEYNELSSGIGANGEDIICYDYDDFGEGYIEGSYRLQENYLTVEIPAGREFNNETFYLTLTSDADFQEKDKFEIPDAVQVIEGYGENGTYLDFNRMMFVNGANKRDVSEYFDDNFIEVVAGGRITAVNEGKQPVSSSITFMLKEV